MIPFTYLKRESEQATCPQYESVNSLFPTQRAHVVAQFKLEDGDVPFENSPEVKLGRVVGYLKGVAVDVHDG